MAASPSPTMPRANANANANSSSNSLNSHQADMQQISQNGAKASSGMTALLSDSGSQFDPFTNELSLTRSDYLLLALGSVLLLPIRAVVIVALLLLAWVVAKLGLLLGLDGDDRRKKTGFSAREIARSGLLKVYASLGLLTFYAAGFSVTLKGKQASRSEAPLLVGAPHSSFLEALIIVMCKSSPVSRSENQHSFLISACQKFTQAIFVDRRSPDSRRQAAQSICDRARAAGDWLQLFIFPEGTNTNRRALIQFKNGAFNPGVPVQPVLIRYAGYERIDAITWTFRQSHSYMFSVWLLLAKPINRVEVEFLPVFVPSEEERASPALFAKHVQELMADQLGVQATDVTYHKYYEEYCRKNGFVLPERQTQKK